MYRTVIVDDEPKICEGIVNLFPWESFGFQVGASFTNGREALEYINSHPDTDLVMTDIEMPVMNGIELSQRLADRNIVVVFFSAYQSFDYARSAIINHVFDYLVKPVNYESISACLGRVKKLLDEKRAGTAETRAPESRNPGITEFVEDYIGKNYRTATLESAAASAHYSPAYLSSAYKAASGMNFSEYLTRFRMRRALRLMQDPSVKLYDIADTVGYKNPKNLSRNFHDYFGITPQEYRAGKPVTLHAEDASDDA